MGRALSLNDQAYNATVNALNDAEKRLEEAADDRDRAWQAAEALHALGEHGSLSHPRRLVIVKGEIRAA